MPPPCLLRFSFQSGDEKAVTFKVVRQYLNKALSSVDFIANRRWQVVCKRSIKLKSRVIFHKSLNDQLIFLRFNRTRAVYEQTSRSQQRSYAFSSLY